MMQTQRMMGWAAGALLVVSALFIAPGCGSDDSPSPNTQITAGSGGSAGAGSSDSGTGGTNVGGSSGTGGTSGNGGSSGDSGTGGTGSGGNGGTNVGGTGNDSGTGGTDADAGGEAGFSSAPNNDAGDADTGTDEDADSGTGGSGGSSGTGGTGSGGSSTGGSSGQGGTGGTTVIPCPADCSGHGTCNTSNGTCACATGFDGAACDTCASGYKSYPTCYQITACPGNNCSGHGSCNDQTGQCTCATGFDGAACDTCASGYKSYPTCYAIQTCPANCSSHGTCNDQTGQCGCSTGFTGTACDACATGYTGYPNCQIPPTPFTCTNYVRNSAFDSFKIDGIPAWLAGGIWGTSNTNVYVSAATYDKGVVAHWNGIQWVKEDLPAGTHTVGNVWGTGDDNLWMVGADDYSNGLLVHRSGGVWQKDANQPSAWGFTDVWGLDANNVYLAGGDPAPKIWKKSGTSWTLMSTPSFTGPTMFRNVWGLDSTHVFATGFNDANNDGNADSGILLRFDGSSWTSVQVPASCRELRAIHGTSFGDLWASGITTSGEGVVYRITNNLATWTPYVNKALYGYQPVFSARAGTALAFGGSEPLQAGNLNITTIDQVHQASTSVVDNKAYGPGVDIWYNAGKAWFVSISDNGQTNPSGVYTADCN